MGRLLCIGQSFMPDDWSLACGKFCERDCCLVVLASVESGADYAISVTISSDLLF